jgi:hypothetical protein
MSASRKQQIEERRAIVPKCFRGIYDKAVRGRSLRAAVNATCLECLCWATNPIRNCSDKACPLYAVRPYQERSQTPRKAGDMAQGRTNSPEGISE